jgi:hypothetical protein
MQIEAHAFNWRGGAGLGLDTPLAGDWVEHAAPPAVSSMAWRGERRGDARAKFVAGPTVEVGGRPHYRVLP